MASTTQADPMLYRKPQSHFDPAQFAAPAVESPWPAPERGEDVLGDVLGLGRRT